MFTKPVSAVLFIALVAVFVALRVFANFGGAAGFAFNVATFILIFMGASYIWQRSEFNQRHRR